MAHTIGTQQAVEAWKIGHRFVLDVYKLTKRLPADEHYGLTPKIRSAAVKIASNIVEGYARQSNDSYLRHLSESQAALEETKYSLLVCRDLGYIADSQYDRVMRDAEALGERLEGMHRQLVATLPEPEGEAKLFGIKKGLRASIRETWEWLTAGPSVGPAKNERRDEPQVWIEERPGRNYLDEARD